jgi:hypothetical protein
VETHSSCKNTSAVDSIQIALNGVFVKSDGFRVFFPLDLMRGKKVDGIVIIYF